MNQTKFYILILPFLCFAMSCIKDKGNYDYNYGNEVTIRYPDYSHRNAFLGEEVTVSPTRTFMNEAVDIDDYKHEWYIDGRLYSEDPDLHFVGEELGQHAIKYYMIDKESGVRYASPNDGIKVMSPFQEGWAILYAKDGRSEMGHIRVTDGVFYDYLDLYKTYNENETMGSDPVTLKDYAVRAGRGLFISQGGGQGSIELDAYSLKKQLNVNQSFTGETPSNFAPLDMGFYSTADLLVNQDGKVYVRYFNNPIPFTTPWLSLPMHIEGGMEITDIWDITSPYFTFMHDQKNNRILQIRLDAPNSTGGVAVIDTMPKPLEAYPPDYANLNHLGSWKYLWGGTFHDEMYAAQGLILLKHEINQEIVLQTFDFKSVNRVHQWTPGEQVTLSAQHHITDKSEFIALKNRDYLFYTGGADNNQLYYIDTRTIGSSTLYEQFQSEITAIATNNTYDEIAIGLDNGTVILFDVSSETIVAKQSKELHRIENLGQVADITLKSSHIR